MKLGDLVYYITKYTGIKWLVNKYHKIRGTECGCDDRRKSWNEIKIKRWQKNFQNMIINYGLNSENQNNQPLTVENFVWYASCTHNITGINITSPAPVHPKQ